MRPHIPSHAPVTAVVLACGALAGLAAQPRAAVTIHDRPNRRGRPALATLAAMAALMLPSSPALASHSGASDSAMGHGTAVSEILGVTQSFQFDARNYDYVSDAHGRVSIEEQGPFGTRTVEGDVHCLRVEGNGATFEARVTRATGFLPPEEPDYLSVHVTDTGKSGTPPDLFLWVPGFGTQGACGSPVPEGEPVVDGDITVRDEPAEPGFPYP